jgi:hypothetical protein
LAGAGLHGPAASAQTSCVDRGADELPINLDPQSADADTLTAMAALDRGIKRYYSSPLVLL